MKIINFGSLNIDHVYRVPHFVEPGETLASSNYTVFAGGKGANQSVAIARAGAPVMHAGKIGPEGLWIKEYLSNSSVDTSLIAQGPIPTGHGIIQITPQGQNSIILFGGANLSISEQDITNSLAVAQPGDLLVMQNELNVSAHLIERASALGMRIALNPAPMTKDVQNLSLSKVAFLFVNEIEGAALAGCSSPPEILSRLTSKLPDTEIILTLGQEGVVYGFKSTRLELPARKVRVVDSTAAGDTFIGYFMAEIYLGSPAEKALSIANHAAAISVSRPGAAQSIPLRAELI